MVTIDGMPIVSSLATVYGLFGIPNSLIDRIEVVKGPASSLYGSEAVGGLINIITKKTLNAPLFSADILGENRGHFPRHAKAYRDFAGERDRLQSERVAAYREYIADIQNGAFPETRHLVAMKDDEFDEFKAALEKLA